MKLRVVASFVLLGSLLLAGSGRTASHGSGLIAFVRADGIYTMDVEGAHVRPLLRVNGGPPAIRWLSWSPDGTKLAFWMRHQIWVMNADGTHRVALVGKASTTPLSASPRLGPASPTWSPDGRSMAFTTDVTWPARADSRALWVVNADGGDMHAVTQLPGPYPAVELAWSPSGKRFAFTRWLWGEGASAVYLMDADGSHQPGWKAWTSMGRNPDWSPDGRRIAFTYGNQIAVVDANGHKRVSLTSRSAVSLDPSWSPDGRKIAFVREPAVKKAPAREREIYVMNADGTNVRRLTDDAVGEASPAWRPTR